jgi:Flp pilus assembly protein TadG
MTTKPATSQIPEIRPAGRSRLAEGFASGNGGAITMIACFLRDLRGGIAMTFSLALVPLLGCVALAVDVSTWMSARTELQRIADGAAITSARELRVGFTTPEQIAEAARAYAEAAIATGAKTAISPFVTAEVSEDRDAVTIAVSSEVSPIFSRILNTPMTHVAVTATAQLSGREPVCMIGTTTSSSSSSTSGIRLRDTAHLDADECGIFSNGLGSSSIKIHGSPHLTAGLACAAGAIDRSGGSIDADLQEYCPPIGDPLEHRQSLISDSSICNAAGNLLSPLRYDTPGEHYRSAGPHCRTIIVENGARLILGSGIHHFAGDGLIVGDGGSVMGNDVTLVFRNGATFEFEEGSTLSFTASRSGSLAGILFIQQLTKDIKDFVISSNAARQLLGTIYLPTGHLRIDASAPVAGDSAYTVIVAHEIDIKDQARLVLNTDYAATDVPVPEGVGPRSQVRLSH